MRVHKHFAEGQSSDRDKRNHTAKFVEKEKEMKKVLEDCRAVICELQRENEQWRGKVAQKDTIIDKLVRQKQEHILHMSTCNTQNLSKQLQIQRERQQEIRRQYAEVTEKYENIVKKGQSQMEKLKSFNRALRVENAYLREQQDSGSKKSRRVGSISMSAQKNKRQQIPFELTQINSLNQEQIIEKSFSTLYHTPQPIKSINSANLPSTQHSKHKPKLTEQRLWKSKELPKTLFNNHALSSFKIVKESETEDTTNSNHRHKQLNHVIRKISQLLASSDDESD